jgi:protein-tyrosine-phosphatase
MMIQNEATNKHREFKRKPQINTDEHRSKQIKSESLKNFDLCSSVSSLQFGGVLRFQYVADLG